MTGWSRIAGACVGLLALLGCHGPASAPHRSTASSIVRATQPAWPDTVGWRVDSTRTLVLGKMDTDLQSSPPRQAFSDVRGAVRLSDGRIIVAEASTQELRVFDSTGKYVRAWGRRGGGPGEFRELDGVFTIPGDTVLALDVGLARITEFSATGSVIATVRYPGLEHVDGALTGARLLVRPGFNGYKPGEYPPALEPVDIVNPSTNRRESLGRYHTKGNAVVEAAQIHSLIPLPFSVGALVAAWGDEAAIGDPDSARSIVVYTHPGLQPRRVAWPLLRKRPTPEDLAEWKSSIAPLPSASTPARLAERLHRLRNLVDQTVANLSRPAALPAFDKLLVDADGNVWAEDYPRATLPGNRWEVFDSAGTWLGHVAIPRMKKVYQIGHAFILGITYGNTYGEPRIVVYRIRQDMSGSTR